MFARNSNFPNTPPASSGEKLLGRILAMCMILMLALGLGVGWLFGRTKGGPDDLTRDTGPVIMAIQQIGQLHTASFTMKDAIRQESDQKPAGWAEAVPGVAAVAKWATHNQAVVVAEGTVEAGLDLSRLSARDVQSVKQPDGSVRLQVHLPPVSVYPPNVRVHVESSSAGLFWRDENIVPKAEAEAGRRFVEAAENERILDHARTGAIAAMQQTMAAIGQKDVDFTF